MASTTPQANADNWLEEPKKIPDMLNVLSILTFIACGIFALMQIWSFTRARASYEAMVQVQSRIDDMPEMAKKFMGPEMVEIARKSYENRVPILLLAMVGFALCAYGAYLMRQFKKTGFYIYVLGEIVLPFVSGFIFVGLNSFSGLALVFGLLIPVVMIILYATQLKYLR